MRNSLAIQGHQYAAPQVAYERGLETRLIRLNTAIVHVDPALRWVRQKSLMPHDADTDAYQLRYHWQAAETAHKRSKYLGSIIFHEADTLHIIQTQVGLIADIETEHFEDSEACALISAQGTLLRELRRTPNALPLAVVI